MRLNSRIQESWLRLLGAADSSQAPRIARLEEGHYAVVCKAARRPNCHVPSDLDDCQAVKPFIPDLARTRAVYMNHETAYGLTKIESLAEWAGKLGQPVERGTQHAFAVVNIDLFAQKVSTSLRALGWKVERLGDCLRVKDDRFTESVNLLLVMVQMVLSRSTFAQAARSLRTELGQRFSLDAQFFARFKKRFAQYRPTVFDHYFTACPESPGLAGGWDYGQLMGRDAHGATEIFEQAMKEFETLLATPQEDWLPALAPDCCEHDILNLEVIHD